MDGSDLSPASRRARAEPARAGSASDETTSPELLARMASVESTVRAVDVRLEGIERQVRLATEQVRADLAFGFQEMASRALVLAEATDEILANHAAALDRIEAMLATLPREVPAPPPSPEPVDLSGVDAALAELRAQLAKLDDRVESSEPRVEEIQRRVADLAVAVIALQPTIDAIVDLRSHVDLVAGRLTSLLGGPSLTELMDRLDEIADAGKQ